MFFVTCTVSVQQFISKIVFATYYYCKNHLISQDYIVSGKS